MNDNKIKFGNVTIGTDPSMLEKVEVLEEVPIVSKETNKLQNDNETKIDSLDVEILDNNEPKKQSPQPKNKKNNSILVVIIALGLIALVGGGVFFYLRLGTNSVNNNTNTVTNETKNETLSISLKNVTYMQGEEISTSISDYIVNNENKNISCSLDLSNVDNQKEGIYDYSVVCERKTFAGIITIVSEEMLKYSNDLLLKQKDENITASDLVISSNSSFSLKEGLKEEKRTINTILLEEKLNDSNVTMDVHSAYILYDEIPEIVLDCEKDEEYNTVIDRFVFNADNEDLKTPLRIYKYYFEDEYYYNYVSQIDSNGFLNLNSTSGYALIDNYMKSISIVTENNYEVLDKEYNGEFPSDFGSIKSYYENKSYTCNF